MNGTVSIISLIISGIMMLIAVITVTKNYGSGMAGQGRIEQKVNDIGSDVKEVRDDVKAQAIQYADIDKRVTRVEESTKSAHHRIDEIVQKGE
jgi:outer membrane murein-binding lipoprotein Lpp